MSTEKRTFQITVPAPVGDQWQAAADASGLSIGRYIILRLEGLPDGAARRLSTAQEAEFSRRLGGSPELPPTLRDRILAEVFKDGRKALAKSSLPKLAKALGVPLRSVHASLGSMVASKRLVRSGDTYYKPDSTEG